MNIPNGWEDYNDTINNSITGLKIDNYTIQHYGVQSLGEIEEQVQIFNEEVMPLIK